MYIDMNANEAFPFIMFILPKSGDFLPKKLKSQI